MNPRVVTAIIGAIITVLGIAGVVYPDRVMGMLGYATMSEASRAAVLGEVRATYGGVFAVMGVFTILSAFDPLANRGRLTLIAAMWIGAAVARLFGTTVDGNPGVFGWASVVFELVVGGLLMFAAWIPGRTVETSLAAEPPYPPPPPLSPDSTPPIP